jgi:methylglyoxal synthase
MVEWCDFNKGNLFPIIAFMQLEKGMCKKELEIHPLKSGPYSGDMELGSMISNEKLDCLIFFWDPLESQPHDVDVKAVLRIAVLYNTPTACIGQQQIC